MVTLQGLIPLVRTGHFLGHFGFGRHLLPRPDSCDQSVVSTVFSGRGLFSIPGPSLWFGGCSKSFHHDACSCGYLFPFGGCLCFFLVLVVGSCVLLPSPWLNGRCRWLARFRSFWDGSWTSPGRLWCRVRWCPLWVLSSTPWSVVCFSLGRGPFASKTLFACCCLCWWLQPEWGYGCRVIWRPALRWCCGSGSISSPWLIFFFTGIRRPWISWP